MECSSEEAGPREQRQAELGFIVLRGLVWRAQSLSPFALRIG